MQRGGHRIGFEQLGGAEIDQLRPPLFRNQNIRRLQVPVNYQITMGIIDGIEYLAEQGQPILKREVDQ